VILHFNHVSRGKSAKSLGELTGLVTASLTTLAEGGAIDPKLLRALRVHLDWIHYKTNFREPVMVRRTTMPAGQPGPLAEIAIDLRQANPETLPSRIAQALAKAHVANAAHDEDGVYLDGFVPWRESIIWQFNRMFWQWLPEWEAASGRGFEEALPSGSSDANHPAAVADDFGVLGGLDHPEEGVHARVADPLRNLVAMAFLEERGRTDLFPRRWCDFAHASSHLDSESSPGS